MSHKTAVVAANIAIVTVLILCVACAALMFRIAQGPMSIGFAKEYVEESLSGIEDGISVRFDDMVVSWPDVKGPLQLNLSKLRLYRGEDDNLLNVEKASVGLARGALLFGRVRPTSVIIEEPALELIRSPEGKLNLFIKEEKTDPAPEQAVAETAPKRPSREVADIFKDMARNKRGTFLSRLDSFEIRDASVVIFDQAEGVSWQLSDLDFAIRDHDLGVESILTMQFPGEGKEGASLSLNMVYRTASDDFRASGQVQNLNPYALSRVLPVPTAAAGQDLYFNGEFEAAADTNLKPTSVKFTGSVPEGAVMIAGEYDAPVPVKNVILESEYSAAENRVVISRLQGELGGVGFSGRGIAEIGPETLRLPLTLQVAAADLAQIPPLFPKSEQNGGAYAWLGRHMEGGKFSNVALAMELAAVKNKADEGPDWIFDLPKFALDFDFTGMKVSYSDTLMPAEDASGHGRLDLAAETLEIMNGVAKIGDIEGKNISVKVTDLMKVGAGFVTVGVDADGPMATALAYIAAEPIGMDKERIGIDAKSVKGNIKARVDLSLPTVKDVPKDQVKVELKGTLSELEIPNVVSGVMLSGGPLALETEAAGFRVKGNAKIDGHDATIDWHQYFESAGNPYSMRIAVKVTADQALRQKFGVGLEEYLSGMTTVDAVYTGKGGGNADIDVNADLAQATIQIQPFQYLKKQGKAGSLSAKAVLREDVLKELTNVTLKAEGLSVSGATIGFAARGAKKADLSSGTLKGAVIGRTRLDAKFNVTKDDVMAIEASGAVFDLMPFLKETERSDINAKPVPQEKKQRMRISVKADEMLAQNEQKVLNARGKIETDTDGDITQIEFDGKVGKGNLSVRFRPDETGKRIFRLSTNDAGATLNTFGLYENIQGGTLLIYGEPKGGNARGDLYGSMRMENFKVVRAPALARLLGLMSLTGVRQLLSNEGLTFSKLESGFEWRFREAGNLLIIKDGKTSGSSVGLTFSGVIDRGKKKTDIAGTIIPMTEINSLLSKIPLVGDILGGASGLIAATYSMKGPTSDPQVSVNPLSVLAPGIIRRIIFEGGYESKIPEDEPVAKTAPAAKAKSVAPMKSAPKVNR